MKNDGLRILSNLRFHESDRWRKETTSIYPDHGVSGSAKLGAFRECYSLWRSAQSFDAVVTMGDRTSLLYGLLCSFTGRSSKQILSELLIETASTGLVARAKRYLFRIAARDSMGLLANSEFERRAQRDFLSMPDARCHFVPLNANPVPGVSKEEEGLVISAGRSGRDYPTLIRSLRGIDMRAELFVGANDLPAQSDSPSLRIHREVERAIYLEGLRRASIVVVPLRPTSRATGQVVLLEAMALGKPIIATRAPGTADYIEDGRTGFLVEPGDAESLRLRLCQLRDQPALRSKIGQNARQAAENTFSIDSHTQRKLQAIRQMTEFHKHSTVGVLPPAGK